MTKPRLFCSFSGGRTSGFMAKMLNEQYSNQYEILNMFANTGQEHEETLRFVQRCDEAFGLNLVWVEAVTHPGEKKSSSHRLVDFASASRNGKPFEDVIAKYGIPNKNFPHCTRELKLNPMKSYLRSIGWEAGSYMTAIGIRIDEMRRARTDEKIIYPLIDMHPMTKADINDFWEEMPFNLNIEERQGNCTWCWKKSFSKHFQLINESPEIYDFPRRMEEEHGQTGAGTLEGVSRVFFRLATSTDGLFQMANEVYERGMARPLISLDENSGCSESCELFPTEATPPESNP